MLGDDHKSNYTQITDNIFIGSDLCKGMSCPIHGAEFEELGILAEINLSVEKKEIPPDGIDIYAWIPVANMHSPTKEQFDIGTAIINEAIANNKNIYIHCMNGHGRSPAMVAAYFVRYVGKSVDESILLIRGKRHEVHLEDVQVEGLRDYEKNIEKL
jgi:protein-tyrosine phosphatase